MNDSDQVWTTQQFTDVVAALENLIEAIKKEDKASIDFAVSDAIETLGYDPSNPEQEYLVSLEFSIRATNPEDATREVIRLLQSDPNFQWTYKVTDEGHVETYC